MTDHGSPQPIIHFAVSNVISLLSYSDIYLHNQMRQITRYFHVSLAFNISYECYILYTNISEYVPEISAISSRFESINLLFFSLFSLNLSISYCLSKVFLLFSVKLRLSYFKSPFNLLGICAPFTFTWEYWYYTAVKSSM